MNDLRVALKASEFGMAIAIGKGEQEISSTPPIEERRKHKRDHYP